MLEEDPIERHLHSREALARWLNEKHNIVNQKTGKPHVSFENYVESFVAAKQHINVLTVGASATRSHETPHPSLPLGGVKEYELVASRKKWMLLAWLLLGFGIIGTFYYFTKSKKK